MLTRETLKLATTVDDSPRVATALLDMANQGKEARSAQRSTYYDTIAGRLRRERIVLCLQEQDGRYIQTVRADVMDGGEFRRRGEWEDVITTEQPDLGAPNTGPHLPPTLYGPELRAQFTAVVSRAHFTLGPNAETLIEGVLAAGEIRTVEGDLNEPITEIGLELKRGDPAALYATALRLLDVAPLRVEIRSAAERGYSLIDAAIDKPEARGSLLFGLDPGMTVDAALQRIGWGCLNLLLRNERAAVANIPEGVHQMRVAIRRLRSVVNAVKRMLPPEQYEWVSRELNWLADILGPARNWDVFASDIVAPIKSALLSERDLKGFSCVAERERRSAHGTANAAIRSAKYTIAVLKLSQWFAASRWRDQAVSQQSARLMAPIGAIAPTLIARRYKKARKAASHLTELTPQQRHEVRIAVKKLRYTIEVLGELFDAVEVARFVDRLKPLQDDLGHANDVRVADELVANLQPSVDAAGVARTAGIVLGWHDRGLADQDRKLRKHVRRLRRAQRFW
jgi:triphosphatase